MIATDNINSVAKRLDMPLQFVIKAARADCQCTVCSRVIIIGKSV